MHAQQLDTCLYPCRNMNFIFQCYLQNISHQAHSQGLIERRWNSYFKQVTPESGHIKNNILSILWCHIPVLRLVFSIALFQFNSSVTTVFHTVLAFCCLECLIMVLPLLKQDRHRQGLDKHKDPREGSICEHWRQIWEEWKRRRDCNRGGDCYKIVTSMGAFYLLEVLNQLVCLTNSNFLNRTHMSVLANGSW